MEFEKDIELYLKRRVEGELGGLCLKLSADVVKGLPDRLVVLPPSGRTVWVELKRKNGRLSEMQKYQHTQLRKRGAEVVVIWSRDQVDELISKEAEP